METLPAFARNLCLVLAKRLETTTLKVPRASGKQLQGNLRFFDLATVIQTLIGSHQTGSLVVTQEGSKQKIAEIFFFKGNIARAKYSQLAGDDAVFQLFQSPLEGEFSFTGRNVAEDEVQTDITMPAISLLMESVRLQDELPHATRSRIPRPASASSARRPRSSSGRRRRRSSWRRRSGRASRRARRSTTCSATSRAARYAIYRTLVTLLDAGQVE